MRKQILVLALVVLLVGVVAGAGNLTNVGPMYFDFGNVIAGTWSVIEFGWDFADDGFNNLDSSLVLRVNFSSLESDVNCPLPLGDCSVWEGDFFLNGYLKQYPLWKLEFLSKESALRCVEGSDVEFRVENGLLYTERDVADGTFYCYDPNDYIDMMELGRRDKVSLNFSSHQALYPGEYGISVELMEMEPDRNGPVIELIKPTGEEDIFSEYDDVVPIKLNITDMYNINSDSVKYKVVSFGVPSDGQGIDADYYDSGWIYEINYNTTSEFYEAEFDMAGHGLTESGEYWIYAEAEDVLGNLGKL